jgi:hypothetical protein
MELLATLEIIFEGTRALGAALEPTVLGPVAFAASGAALQGLQTQVDGELPGGAFLYVTTHGLWALSVSDSLGEIRGLQYRSPGGE